MDKYSAKITWILSFTFILPAHLENLSLYYQYAIVATDFPSLAKITQDYSWPFLDFLDAENFSPSRIGEKNEKHCISGA